MNIPTKAFCSQMCVLFVCSESCFYTFGRIAWVGWRLACREDGWGWPTIKSATGDPPFLMQDECDSSPLDHQLILMNDPFKGTTQIV